MAYIETRQLSGGEHSYRVVWEVPGANRRTRRKWAFDDRGSAERFRGVLEASGPDVALRMLAEADAPDARTVAEQVAHHIEHLTGVEEGTRRDYAAMLRRSIAPALGSIPITILTRDDVAKWVNEQSNVRPKTVKNRHSLLSAALTSAVQADLIPSNPALGVRMPTAVEEEMCFLTQAEFARLVTLTPPRWRPLVLFLGATGMRWGEATALTVGAVNLTAGEIRITQAWKETRGAGQKLGPPKTKRGRRTIPVPSVCRPDLEALTRDQAPTTFLFRNTRGNPVRHNSFWGTVWEPLVHVFAGDIKRTIKGKRGRPKVTWEIVGEGKRPRIHDLRHSYASWAISAGHSLPALQSVLGHESIQTTVNRYGHIFRADRDAFRELVTVDIGGNQPALTA